MATQEPIYRHLTDDGLVGDGTNHHANVNGGTTPVAFWAGPTEHMWAIHRILIAIEDNAVITADKYGGIDISGGTGVELKIMSGDPLTGSVVLDLLDGDPVKSHVGWAEHCYDLTEHSFGSGNNFVLVRWTLSAAGRPVVLDSKHQEKLVLVINDDLSGLVNHEIQLQGHLIYGVGDQLNTWGT